MDEASGGFGSPFAVFRGSVPAVMLIHAGAEDAEGWRPIAERLTGLTVVTYDPRGTLRSCDDDWPGRGSAQHADDAAGLLEALGLGDAVVLGYSSSGNITLQLALRHHELIRRAPVYEPGYLRWFPTVRTYSSECAMRSPSISLRTLTTGLVPTRRCCALPPLPRTSRLTLPPKHRNRGRGTTSGRRAMQ